MDSTTRQKKVVAMPQRPVAPRRSSRLQQQKLNLRSFNILNMVNRLDPLAACTNPYVRLAPIPVTPSLYFQHLAAVETRFGIDMARDMPDDWDKNSRLDQISLEGSHRSSSTMNLECNVDNATSGHAGSDIELQPELYSLEGNRQSSSTLNLECNIDNATSGHTGSDIELQPEQYSLEGNHQSSSTLNLECNVDNATSGHAGSDIELQPEQYSLEESRQSSSNFNLKSNDNVTLGHAGSDIQLHPDPSVSSNIKMDNLVSNLDRSTSGSKDNLQTGQLRVTDARDSCDTDRSLECSIIQVQQWLDEHLSSMSQLTPPPRFYSQESDASSVKRRLFPSNELEEPISGNQNEDDDYEQVDDDYTDPDYVPRDDAESLSLEEESQAELTNPLVKLNINNENTMKKNTSEVFLTNGGENPQYSGPVNLPSSAVVNEKQAMEDSQVQNCSVDVNSVPVSFNNAQIRQRLAEKCLPVLPKNLERFRPLLPNMDIPCYTENTRQVVPSAAGGKRSRRYFCPYCKMSFSSLPSHLTNKHSEEQLVATLSSLPKDHEDRKPIFKAIRIWGTCMYNSNRMYNKGVLRVLRRSSKQEPDDASEYSSCPNCSMVLKKARLHRHYRNCSGRTTSGSECHLLVQSRQLVGDLHRNASTILRRRIFPVLKDDECSNAVKYDDAVIVYGNDSAMKYSTSSHHDKMIRANIRMLGRLILSARELCSSVSDLASLMVPPMKDVVQSAILKIAGYSEELGSYNAPASATHCANVLRQAAELWRVECIKRESPLEEQRVERFVWIIKKQVIPVLSKTVIENRTRLRRRKKIVLPDQGDIDLLTSYVLKGFKRCAAKLESSERFNYTTWRQLGEYIVVYLMVYNRRRPGEVERMCLEDFEAIVVMDKNDPLYDSLSKVEKKFADRVQLFLIRGKLNRTVNVLLPSYVKDALAVFTGRRQKAGVAYSNPYLFGLCKSKYIDAGKALRYCALRCNAKKPAVLRATLLRKEFATRAATFNLPENVAKDLADHMGHDRAIHKDIYRQPTFTRSILPVAQVLEKALGISYDDEEASPVASTSLTQLPSPLPSTSTSPATKRTKPMKRVSFSPSGHETSSAKRKIVSIDGRLPHRPSPQASPSQRSFSQTEELVALKYFFRKQAELRRPLVAADLRDALKLPELSHRSLPELNLFMENHLKADRSKPKSRYVSSPKKPKPYKCRDVSQRLRWTPAALNALKTAFEEYLHPASRILPSKDDILLAKANYPVLENRSVPCIKVAIANMRKRLNGQ